MAWFLIVLIIASIVYMVLVVGNYKGALEEAQDVIRDQEKQATLLERSVSHEKEILEQQLRRISELQQTSNEIKQEIYLTDSKLKMAQQAENDLEMNMYKQEFKKSKQRKY